MNTICTVLVSICTLLLYFTAHVSPCVTSLQRLSLLLLLLLLLLWHWFSSSTLSSTRLTVLFSSSPSSDAEVLHTSMVTTEKLPSSSLSISEICGSSDSTLLSVHCSVTHQLWRCLHSAGLREWVCVQGNLSCLVLIYNPSAICRHACLPLPDHDGLSDRRRGEEKQERWRRNTNLIGQANIDGADPVWAPKQLSQGDNLEAHLDCDASKRMLHTVAHPCEKRQMVCSACVDAARSYSPLIRNTR